MEVVTAGGTVQHFGDSHDDEAPASVCDVGGASSAVSQIPVASVGVRRAHSSGRSSVNTVAGAISRTRVAGGGSRSSPHREK